MKLSSDASPYRKVQLWLVGAIIAAEAFVIALSPLKLAKGKELFTWYLFGHQDALIIPALILAIFLLKPEKDGGPFALWQHLLEKPVYIFLLAVGLVGLAWAGHYLVFLGRDFTRDEQMANFDAYIFSHGRLFWPIPSEWRQFAYGLNQTFILPIGNHEAWVSAYLPVNALFRVIVGAVADPALTSPLLVGTGAIALWKIAKRLWPESLEARTTALLLYAGSSQVLIMGMTVFAMTAHLALNLIWLFLFLWNSRASHIGAIAVGFLATGLHQPLFHPLFVFPFMLLLLGARRWRLLLLYGFCYTLIGLFWLSWPVWISSHGVGQIPVSNEGVDFLTRLVLALPSLSLKGIWLTTMNLLRFVAWQHLLLLPLLVLGMKVAWRGEPIARALALGFLLPIPIMLILLPYQGHGWGYRYLHGVIGNACLLGGYGLRELQTQGLSMRRAMTWATCATFLIIVPAEAFIAHRMIKPYAEVDRMIAESGAQIAIIQDYSAPFAQDLALNRPDLSNRPIRLMTTGMRVSNVLRICSRQGVKIFTVRDLGIIDQQFGKKLSKPSKREIKLQNEINELKCGI